MKEKERKNSIFNLNEHSMLFEEMSCFRPNGKFLFQSLCVLFWNAIQNRIVRDFFVWEMLQHCNIEMTTTSYYGNWYKLSTASDGIQENPVHPLKIVLINWSGDKILNTFFSSLSRSFYVYIVAFITCRFQHESSFKRMNFFMKNCTIHSTLSRSLENQQHTHFKLS